MSREVSIASPVYGTVGQVRYRVGDVMQEGDIMLKILHTDRRYVVCMYQLVESTNFSQVRKCG